MAVSMVVIVTGLEFGVAVVVDAGVMVDVDSDWKAVNGAVTADADVGAEPVTGPNAVVVIAAAVDFSAGVAIQY